MKFDEAWKAIPVKRIRTLPEPKKFRMEKNGWSGTVPVHPEEERDFLDFCLENGWSVNEEVGNGNMA